MNGSSAYSNSQLREDFKKEHAAALQAKMLPYRTTGPDVDIVVYFTDEISKVSADLFGRAELQERQVKRCEEKPHGGLSKIVGGDNNGPRASRRYWRLLCQTNVLFDCENTYCIGTGQTHRQTGRQEHTCTDEIFDIIVSEASRSNS